MRLKKEFAVGFAGGFFIVNDEFHTPTHKAGMVAFLALYGLSDWLSERNAERGPAFFQDRRIRHIQGLVGLSAGVLLGTFYRMSTEVESDAVLYQAQSLGSSI